jgi:hypothetical protein
MNQSYQSNFNQSNFSQPVFANGVSKGPVQAQLQNHYQSGNRPQN